MNQPKTLVRAVLDRLEQAFSNSFEQFEYPIALFDWDNTCIEGDCSEAFLKYVVHHGLLETSAAEVFTKVDPALNWQNMNPLKAYEACHENPAVPRKELYAAFSLLFSGHSLSRLKQVYSEFMQLEMAPKKRPSILELMDRFETGLGISNVIISASPRYMVEFCMQGLGYHRADRKYERPCHGLSHQTGEDGLLKDHLASDAPVTYGPGKVEVAKMYYPNATPVVVFGDADTDFDMFLYENGVSTIKVFLGDLRRQPKTQMHVESLNTSERERWLLRGIDFEL